MRLMPSSLLGFAAAFLLGVCVGVAGYTLYSRPDEEILETPDTSPATHEESGSTAVHVAKDEDIVGKGQEASARDITPREAVPDRMDSDLGVVVYGTVRDQAGLLVESARLSFQPEQEGGSAIYVSVDKGGYTAHGLQPGIWKTMVRGKGLEKTEGMLEIGSEPVIRKDLVVSRAYVVTVRVRTPDDKPLIIALRAAKLYNIELSAVATRTKLTTVPMTDTRYHRDFGIARWTSQRFFARGKQKAEEADVLGYLELHSPPPASISLMLKHHLLAQQQILPGQREVSFKIAVDEIESQTAQVRLRVIDKVTRNPIGNAHVSITDRQSMSGGLPTGEDGTILLKHQATGLMEIDIRTKNYERYHANLRIPAGDVDLGTIELGPPIQARGIVVDAAGKPVMALVTWMNLDHRKFPQPLATDGRTSSDSKGIFELTHMGRGRYLVRAQIRDKSLATRIIHTDNLSGDPFRMVLVPTWPLKIDTTKMSPRRFVTIEIRDPQRQLVYARYLSPGSQYKTRLPAGNYSCQIFEGDKQVQTSSITVAPETSPTIRIQD